MIKSKLLTITFIISCLISTEGKNVYIYNEKSNKPINTFTNVRKITFTENTKNITESNDKTSEIPLSDFNFFTFIEKVISSVEMPSKSNTIVYIDTNDILSIKTDNTIDNVEIFSVNGNKILSSIPVSSTFSHSLASYPAGMYIVKTRIGENQEFHKIIKK